MQQLEQRIKTLEYELKILKSEVQRTLLDIQEQILLHYYPSLRTEELTPTESINQTLASIQEKRQNLGGSSEPTEVRKVSLKDVKVAPQEPPVSPEGELFSQPEEGEGDQDEILKLSGWASSTVQKIGAERTARLIQACTSKGIFSPDTESPLLRLAGLVNADDVPEQVAVNDILGALIKLSKPLGREIGIEEALSIIEEANLG